MAFRKTFTLDQAVPSATAFISAVDKYVLWVNGELVVLDGALKRGPTPYDSYYDTVELTNPLNAIQIHKIRTVCHAPIRDNVFYLHWGRRSGYNVILTVAPPKGPNLSD